MRRPLLASWRRRFRSLARAIAFVALVGSAPVAAVITIGRLPDDLDTITPPARPIAATVRQSTDRGERRVEVRLSWRPGAPVLAPAWSGTVTSIAAAPGEVLQQGDEVLAIDGIARIAARTPRPFHRDLVPGDRGADVDGLNQFLRSQGWRAGTADTWTAETSSGVRELERRVGLEPSPLLQFDAEWMVWLPVDHVVVGSIPISIGSDPPAKGVPVVVAQPELTGAVVVSSGSGADAGALPSDDAIVLVVEDLVIDLPRGARTVPAGVLDQLQASTVPGRKTIVATARLRTPKQVSLVPATALITDPIDGYCVLVASSERPRRAVEVIPHRGPPGTVDVGAAVPDGTALLANASEIEPGRRCR